MNIHELRRERTLAEVVENLLSHRVPTAMLIPGLSPGLVENAVSGFFEFLKTRKDWESSWQLDLTRDPEEPGADDGLIRRDLTDRKIFFHFRPDLEFWLQKKHNVRLSAKEKAWFEACLEIHVACSKALFALSREMDTRLKGYEFGQRARELSKMNVLRIMRYDAGYTTLGRMHTDRNALTFHIAESDPGLETVHGFETRSHKSPTLPRALAFTGKNFERITRGAVPALWHGAKDQSGSRQSRWVVVFFGHMARDKDMY